MRRKIPITVKNNVVQTRLALNDGVYIVTISKPTKPRSDRANRYYWGVIIAMLCEKTGYTPQEMHECLLYEFSGMFDHKTGLMKIQKRTSEMSSVEFEDYQSRIRLKMSEVLDVYIPLPNEVEY